MILQYKCGHETIGPLWKDDLVVKMNIDCPSCLRRGYNPRLFKRILIGTKVLIVKRAWRKQ